MPTPPVDPARLAAIEGRVAAVETHLRDHRDLSATRHTEAMDAINALTQKVDELLTSQGGSTPTPKSNAKKSSTWTFAIAPGTGRELGLAAAIMLGSAGAAYFGAQSKAPEVVEVPVPVPVQPPVAP